MPLLPMYKWCLYGVKKIHIGKLPNLDKITKT